MTSAGIMALASSGSPSVASSRPCLTEPASRWAVLGGARVVGSSDTRAKAAMSPARPSCGAARRARTSIVVEGSSPSHASARSGGATTRTGLRIAVVGPPPWTTRVAVAGATTTVRG
ncbi:hypothetical protein [Streptomyces durbertensis]|uniref:hypothetical protein n=1 Tax=Streptomyces durbertensis TaxID=2448886 RepID=UPI003F69DE40